MIKLGGGRISTGSTTLPVLAKVFVTLMLTRDLFAVADLLVLFEFKVALRLLAGIDTSYTNIALYRVCH